VLRRGVLPRLGQGELKRLGGQDEFRSLFKLPPADLTQIVAKDALIIGQIKGVDFVLDENHKPDGSNHENIRLAIAALGYHLAFDSFSWTMTVSKAGKGCVVDDGVVDRIWFECDNAFGFRPSFQLFEKTVFDAARLNNHHPVQDYLNSLPEWDGVERVGRWLIDFAGAEDTEFNRVVSVLPLVAAVRRILNAGNPGGIKFDELLVLRGPQGQGKSKLFARLCPRPEWFTDSMALGDKPKETIEQSRGIWVSEIPELLGGARETEKIKAYLSRSVDGPARMAYTRVPVRVARQFVNFGTTNDRYFLKDPTGNRRFWPVTVTELKPEALLEVRDMIWAEVLVLEAQGQSVHLPESLWATAGELQEAHREIDPWEDVLRDIIDVSKPAVPTASCWIAVGAADTAKQDARSGRRISDIMQRMGYPCKKVLRVKMPDGTIKVIRCWVKDKDQGGVDFPGDLGGASLPF
jgi:predicted P-loop ATPase